MIAHNCYLVNMASPDPALRQKSTYSVHHGAFGLTNDYIRLAHNVLKVDLGVVAGFMLLVSLAVLPVAWILSRPVRRGDFR